MKQIIIFLSVVGLAGCSSPKHIIHPEDFKYHVKGLYLDADIEDEEGIIGEIIEVNENEIKILPVKGKTGIRTISKNEFTRLDVIIAGTSNDPETITLWGGLVNLVSISHGAYGVITLPINIISTVSIGKNATHGTYRMNYPETVTWDGLKKFARFPQGIPDYINENRIK